MKKIPVKNYFVLALIFVIVVVVTFSLANFYNNMLRPTSVLYKYAKHINNRELIDYLQENSSTIIYISDKYNTLLNEQEEILKKKIVEYNLYNNLIYIDKNELNDNFYDNFNKKYNTHIDQYNLPTMIILNDSVVESIYYSLSFDTIKIIEFGGIK